MKFASYLSEASNLISKGNRPISESEIVKLLETLGACSEALSHAGNPDEKWVEKDCAKCVTMLERIAKKAPI